MKNGGKRAGAGRPKGSGNLPNFRDYITDNDIQTWMEILRDQVVNDPKLLMWALDHYYGKAHQTVEGNMTGSLTISFDNAFTSSTEKGR